MEETNLEVIILEVLLLMSSIITFSKKFIGDGFGRFLKTMEKLLMSSYQENEVG
ncbi:hypothetical protein REPUB_Repub10bG0053900 [Reevesia pubescens]